MPDARKIDWRHVNYLGINLLPKLNKLIKLLERERDPVVQQQLLELLVARYCMRFGRAEGEFIAQSIHRHIMKFIIQPPWEAWRGPPDGG
jgi:hypothetical protein